MDCKFLSNKNECTHIERTIVTCLTSNPPQYKYEYINCERKDCTLYAPEQTKSKVKQILDHFGIRNQRLKLVEEMAELTKVIIKMETQGSTPELERKYIGELADVDFVMDQLKLEPEAIELPIIKDGKADRTIDRIAERYYNKNI